MASERASSEEWQYTESSGGDDDMDYELATEDSATPSSYTEDGEDDDEAEGDDEVGTTLYYDAEEGTFVTANGDQIVFETEETVDEVVEEGESEDGTQTPTVASSAAAASTAPTTPAVETRPTISATQQQILRLLQQAGIQSVFTSGTRGGSRRQRAVAGDAPEDDDAPGFWSADRYRRRRPKFVGDRYPKVPSEEGSKLMASGQFGTNDRCSHTACGEPLSDRTQYKRRRLSYRMLDRELGVENRGRNCALNALATHEMIPGSKADMIINANAPCYSGQFSEDGSFFFACGRDFKVRMYDTRNPYDWRYYKTVNYYGGQWTITDASLSPDNRHLAYSSISSRVCLAPTDPADDSEPTQLDFSDMGGGGSRGGGGWGRRGGHFGIWSLRYSGDGSEIVAGTSDYSVYVYDIESQRSILRIPGHSDDVNAVCFGDKMSPHILYSGSDDTTLKVWDRRSLSSMRPAGMFLGHTEGLTYIDSKGDGRYVISNGKDQTCKLWDLRRMISTDDAEKIDPRDHTTSFDYRFAPYDEGSHTPHPNDCSLVTFRGHRVLKTLIRCHFSPLGSTNQRYIYSGSHDGKIYVWNLDGTIKSKISVLEATKNCRPSEDYAGRGDYYENSGQWKTIVRDCSWHPSAPVIAATSWNGNDHTVGTCTVHSWNDGVGSDEVGDEEDGEDVASFANKDSLGSTPMGARVTAQLRHDGRFYGMPQPRRGMTARTRSVRERLGGIWGGVDDDE
nr:hypothetical protein B0A51_00456 [Rachicladosporium sp. CCFEE 5018]